MPLPGRATAAEQLEPPSAAAVAYCRQARRLRARFAGRPARLHRGLRELAGAGAVVGSAPVPPPASGARAFADLVPGHMEGMVLRYAQRRKLLATARRMGMGAFEANLIIAAVQHARRNEPVAAVATPNERGSGRYRFLGPTLVALALESILMIGAWQVGWG